MQTKFLISILALCCALMTGALLLNSQAKAKTAVSTPSTHFEKAVDSYQISLDARTVPLKTETETFVLKVYQTTENALAANPEVTVTMTMGNMHMKAPTTVKKLDNKSFLVTSEFTMAGIWTFSIKPANNVAAVIFKVPVQ